MQSSLKGRVPQRPSAEQKCNSRGSAAISVMALSVAACTLNHSAEVRRELADINLSLPMVPLVRRDLGFMSAEMLSQLEVLSQSDVDATLRALPASCAVCRIAALEASLTGLIAGLEDEDTSSPWSRALAQTLCERCSSRGLLGVLPQRQAALRRVCDEVMSTGLAANLSVTGAKLAGAAAKGHLALERRPLEEACASICPTQGAVESWPAFIEIVLGHVR